MLQMLIKKVLFSAFFIVCILSNHYSFAQSNNEPTSSNLNVNSSCPELSSFDDKTINRDEVKVIVDGDTIYTKNGSKLKLVHVNAPEINHSNKTLSDKFAIKSREAIAQFFKNNSTIYWVYDKKQQDRYKRDLVFAFNSSGVFINAEILKSGLAQLLVIPPNELYWQCLYNAEKKAIKSKSNLWGSEDSLTVSTQSLNKNSRFKTVQGIVTKIITDKNYRWIVLDDRLWVGVKNKDLKYFSDEIYNYKIGNTMKVYGRVFEYYKKLRMSLRHQAMLLPVK